MPRPCCVRQGVACLGPAAAMLLLGVLGEGWLSGVGAAALDRNGAQVLFVAALASASCSAAGYGCGAQDISKRCI